MSNSKCTKAMPLLGLSSPTGFCFLEGVRTHVISPYFLEKPINPAAKRALVAGGGMGSPSGNVDAATRLVAESSILERGSYIAPKA